MVISVGIDVSKDKHDCFILNSEGEVLAEVFTIPNTMDGFNCLLQKIQDSTMYKQLSTPQAPPIKITTFKKIVPNIIIFLHI